MMEIPILAVFGIIAISTVIVVLVMARASPSSEKTLRQDNEQLTKVIGELQAKIDRLQERSRAESNDASLKRTLDERLKDLDSANEELRRLTKELQAERDYALSTAQTKSQFLANMSHEIRTPLNGLIATTELLLQSQLSEEQRDYVLIGRESALNLLETVNDLLDFSHVESGKLSLEKMDFDVRALVVGAAELMSARASAKGLALMTYLANDVPSRLYGDPTRLRQILIQLLSNSIKFTEDGEVVCRVTLEDTDQTCVYLRFSVYDTGVGMSRAVQQTLFEPFTQADGSMTRRHSGIGLGLSIAQRMVELMEGAIGVESTEGQGSTFWFVVPLEDRCATPATPRQPSQEPKRKPQDKAALPGDDSARPMILVAEDNPINQRVARLQLEELGYRVHISKNGAEALEAAMSMRYDAILMDCAMPVVDGYEATRRIRKQEALIGRHTPIIALTAHSLPGDKERCLDCGMDDYLSKPVTKDDLSTTIKRWLRRSARPTSSNRSSKPSSTSAET